jgi:hypothetical protein
MTEPSMYRVLRPCLERLSRSCFGNEYQEPRSADQWIRRPLRPRWQARLGRVVFSFGCLLEKIAKRYSRCAWRDLHSRSPSL